MTARAKTKAGSTRRAFLKNSTLLGTAWWVGHPTLLAQSRSANERMHIACVGAAGKGGRDAETFAEHCDIVALCDIDDRALEQWNTGKHRAAAKFNDFREMFDQVGKKIDAVTVGIPDHSHAVASIMGMKLGKHCWTQKPLTWSVHEARRMREVAAEMNVMTQMGNQGTAEPGFRTAVELVRAGTLGNVSEVHVWTNRPVWPQGISRPRGATPIPKNVHWDLFLGPAPVRPFHDDVPILGAGRRGQTRGRNRETRLHTYHPFSWRGWCDFGSGALGDMACHTANMAVMSLELFDPVSVEAESSGVVDNETYPKWSIIRYEFGQRGKLAPCTLFWYDGGKYPPARVLQGQQATGSGLVLVGDEGSLFSPNDYGASFTLYPESKFKNFKPPEPTMPRYTGVKGQAAHVLEFVNACRGGHAPASNFGYAGRLTETMLLGNVALRAGKKIVWDAANLKVTNVPEANQYIKRQYRAGYSV